MRRPNHPKRWQLDVFMVLMIVLMIVLLQAHLSASWETAGEIAWSVLALVGMGLWVHVNWAALQDEEQQKRGRRPTPDQSGPPESRTIPLTPTQRRFLAVTRAHRHPEDTE
jgi:hypothetical protein